MEDTDRLNNYRSILQIRQKAYRRDSFITGGVFLVMAFIATGMLLFTEWNMRSIWLMSLLFILNAAGFLMTWVRYHTTKEKIELLDQLQITK